MSIKITIPISPVTKKNHGQIVYAGGKPRLIPSKQFREYQEAAGYFLKEQGINYPCNIKCLFYMPTHRIVDLVGLLQAIDDVLVHYKVIEDDNSRIVASHDGSRVLYDKEYPRTEIEITKAKLPCCDKYRVVKNTHDLWHSECAKGFLTIQEE